MIDHLVFCDAIKKLKVILLQYDADKSARRFAPHAVYKSSTGKILVTGVQIDNPAEPWERLEPRNFDISKVRSAAMTDESFSKHPRFNPSGKQYARGFICRVR